MLEQYILQLADIEKEWYSRDPIDNSLRDKLVEWLKNDSDINVIKLDTTINLKYFVRSYRAAFEKVIDGELDIEKVEKGLKKINKKLKENSKKPLSRTQYLNLVLKKILKHDRYIRVDDVYLEMSSNPSTSHLGNCHVRNIGKYSDIWPVLNLITDCNAENNKKLAQLLLDFADNPTKVTKEKLGEINPKFLTAEFNTTTNYFCNFLTSIAMHYVFFEISRRVVLTEEEERFGTEASNTPVASSILVILKALKDGFLTKLEDAFSPTSKYLLITKDGVNKLSKSTTESAAKKMSVLGINRMKQEHEKTVVSSNDIAAHALYPNSETFDSDETEQYPGKKIRVVPKKK